MHIISSKKRPLTALFLPMSPQMVKGHSYC